MAFGAGFGTQGGWVAEREDAWGEYARELGLELNRRRHAAGLSQERLAHAAGITRFHYQQLEKGESKPGTPANPNLRTILALAQVLGMPLEELLPDEPPDVTTGR
jgi:transcriptional regulator with XRE-family HTH domain